MERIKLEYLGANLRKKFDHLLYLDGVSRFTPVHLTFVAPRANLCLGMVERIKHLVKS